MVNHYIYFKLFPKDAWKYKVVKISFKKCCDNFVITFFILLCLTIECLEVLHIDQHNANTGDEE